MFVSPKWMHPKMHLMECLQVCACIMSLWSLNYVFIARTELRIDYNISQSTSITSSSCVQTLDNWMHVIKIKPIPLGEDLIFFIDILTTIGEKKTILSAYNDKETRLKIFAQCTHLCIPLSPQCLSASASSLSNTAEHCNYASSSNPQLLDRSQQSQGNKSISLSGHIHHRI